MYSGRQKTANSAQTKAVYKAQTRYAVNTPLLHGSTFKWLVPHQVR